MHCREIVVQAKEARRAVGGEDQRAQDQIGVLPQPQCIIRAGWRRPASCLARQRAEAARHSKELGMSDRRQHGVGELALRPDPLDELRGPLGVPRPGLHECIVATRARNA